MGFLPSAESLHCLASAFAGRLLLLPVRLGTMEEDDNKAGLLNLPGKGEYSHNSILAYLPVYISCVFV
jgi:hypothetical protein